MKRIGIIFILIICVGCISFRSGFSAVWLKTHHVVTFDANEKPYIWNGTAVLYLSDHTVALVNGSRPGLIYNIERSSPGGKLSYSCGYVVYNAIKKEAVFYSHTKGQPDRKYLALTQLRR